MAAAEARGVLIQPAAHFYSGGNAPRNVFRMSVSGIPEERIRPGVEALSRALRAMLARERETGGAACLPERGGARGTHAGHDLPVPDGLWRPAHDRARRRTGA